MLWHLIFSFFIVEWVVHSLVGGELIGFGMTLLRGINKNSMEDHFLIWTLGREIIEGLLMIFSSSTKQSNMHFYTPLEIALGVYIEDCMMFM